MTFPAVDRVEPALVPAIIGADMAIEAPHLAMRTLCELNRIDLVALATRVFILGIGHLRREQQTGRQDGENGQEIAH